MKGILVFDMLAEWIIGNPYTTETVVTASDSAIVFACDGVCLFNGSYGMSVLISTRWILSRELQIRK